MDTTNRISVEIRGYVEMDFERSHMAATSPEGPLIKWQRVPVRRQNRRQHPLPPDGPEIRMYNLAEEIRSRSSLLARVRLMTAHDAIADAYRAFEEAYHNGDAETISRMYTEDSEWLIPEAPVVKGRQAIAQTWKRRLGSGGNNIRVDTGEVQECGDWAYEVGRFTRTASDGSFLAAGKYIVIWKQQSSGEWKVHRDIISPDSAPPPDSRS